MRAAAFRFGPIARVSLGLMALFISFALVADLLTGVVPSRLQAERQTRQRVAENLALQVTGLLHARDESLVSRTIHQVLSRDRDMRSVSVHRNDGGAVLIRGPGDAEGSQISAEIAALNTIRVPIYAGPRLWGEIAVRFADTAPRTLTAWLWQPAIQMLVLLGIGGFFVCYAYLRRAMQFLDPSAAVPSRVRKAFDLVTDGVVILDQQGRIVLANQAFRQLHPDSDGDVNGRLIDSFAWLLPTGADGSGRVPPWTQSLNASMTRVGESLTVHQSDGSSVHLLVTSAPIADADGRARGCMVTFNDVTPVHRVNDALRRTLGELERSREQIEAQNRELSKLATRDSLTGCLNRRAFHQAAERVFGAAKRAETGLCCVMVDIDHFKQVNDLYGHAVGDRVIQVVARTLSEGMRDGDILCRYGGEEFCILLPGASLPFAMDVAERLRAAVLAGTHGAIPGTEATRITASLGVSTVAFGAESMQDLTEQADQALYRSKDSGRNRVTAFEPAYSPGTGADPSASARPVR